MIKTFLYSCFFLLTISQNVFSQKKYTFDYYSKYEYQVNEGEAVSLINTVLANSKDSTFCLVIAEKDNKIVRTYFIDKISKTKTDIKSNQFYKDLNENKLEITAVYDVANQNFSKNLDYVKTTEFEPLNKYIITMLYKSDKKKIFKVYHIEYEPSELYSNQIKNHPDLQIPLMAEKFSLALPGIAKKTYFIVNGKKEFINTLVELKEINFSFVYDLKKQMN